MACTRRRIAKDNFVAAVLIALVAWGLILLTDNVPQWVALGIGIYVVYSWVQSLKARDPVTYHMIFQSKAMVYTMLAFPTIFLSPTVWVTGLLHTDADPRCFCDRSG